MIRINLLPYKKKKKPKPVPKFLVIAILSTVIVMAGSVTYNQLILKSEIRNKQTQKEDNARKIAELEKQIQQVRDYEANKKLLTDRLNIIRQLERNQSQPVKVLDELSSSLTDLVWLKSLNIEGNDIDMLGVGFTNNDVVKFVESLKNSPLFSDVYLHETRQTKEKGVDVYSFKLTLRVKG